MAVVQLWEVNSVAGIFTGKFRIGHVTGTTQSNLVVNAAILAEGTHYAGDVAYWLNSLGPYDNIEAGTSVRLYQFDSNCYINARIVRKYIRSSRPPKYLAVINLDIYVSGVQYTGGPSFEEEWSNEVNSWLPPANNIDFFVLSPENFPNGGIGWAVSNLASQWSFNMDFSVPLYNYLVRNDLIAEKTDITFPGETGTEGGGTGTFDLDSDAIDFPGLPSLSVVDAGLITLYSPSAVSLKALGQYLWSDAFDIDTFKKLFTDPMECILGLSIVPINITGTLGTIKFGELDSNVVAVVPGSQYFSVDCGSINMDEYWGSALDYSPYSKFSIYLPYIGMREVKTDDIRGKNIHVKYSIDILSGSCTAMVKCGDAILYQYGGSCATNVPLSAISWTNSITSLLSLMASGAAVAATGGGAIPFLIPAGASAVASAKPTVQRGGSVSGSSGFLGIQKPYLIAEIPRQALAESYNSYVGYPCNLTKTLSSLTGFTQVESIHLENIPATSEEIQEIENLLKDGVIL